MRHYIEKLRKIFSPKPDISVIVPIFNKDPFVADCLDSILSQQNVDIEVICINDGATDNSSEIVKSYMKKDSRVRLLENKHNLGPGPSRNLGIMHARGRYLQFTDADDLLTKNALWTLFDAANKNNVCVVCGGIQTSNRGVIQPVKERVFLEKKVGSLGHLPEIWIPWYHVCYLLDRKFIVKSCARYPELRMGEDPVFIANVNSLANSICLIPDIVYTHRIGETRSNWEEKTVQDYVEHALMIKEIYLPEKPKCWEIFRKSFVEDVSQHIKKADMPSDRKLIYQRKVISLFSN